jgi:hypothetical protein
MRPRALRKPTPSRRAACARSKCALALGRRITAVSEPSVNPVDGHSSGASSSRLLAPGGQAGASSDSELGNALDSLVARVDLEQALTTESSPAPAR